jgi:hypothetical protein
MDTGFRKDYELAEKDLIAKRMLIELLYHAISTIPVPANVQAPKLQFSLGTGCRGVFVNIHGWETEMFCSYVSEIEDLLKVEAQAIKKEHYYGDTASLIYNFNEATSDLYFQVINFEAKGCKVTFKPSYTSKDVESFKCD